jgi:hypothetical protein
MIGSFHGEGLETVLPSRRHGPSVINRRPGGIGSDRAQMVLDFICAPTRWYVASPSTALLAALLRVVASPRRNVVVRLDCVRHLARRLASIQENQDELRKNHNTLESRLISQINETAHQLRDATERNLTSITERVTKLEVRANEVGQRLDALPEEKKKENTVRQQPSPPAKTTWFASQGFYWEVLPNFESQYRHYAPEYQPLVIRQDRRDHAILNHAAGMPVHKHSAFVFP